MDRQKSFDLLEVETINGTFLIGLERSFDEGTDTPSNVRNCKDCVKSESKK